MPRERKKETAPGINQNQSSNAVTVCGVGPNSNAPMGHSLTHSSGTFKVCAVVGRSMMCAIVLLLLLDV